MRIGRRRDDGDGEVPRLCRRVRERLPAYDDGSLGRMSARVVRRHLERCSDCRADHARQQEVAAGLASLREPDPAPPPGLLDDLLAATARRDLRARAAVPARGAVSGARPGLSIAFLAAGAIAGTGAGWALWRGSRAVRRRLAR